MFFKKNPSAQISKSGKGYLLLASVLCLVTGFLVYQALDMAIPKISVLVTTRELKPGDVITKENLSVVKVPKASVPSDRVTGLDEVLNKHSKTYVAAGDPIRKVHVAEIDGGGNVAARLNLVGKNTLAVALPPESVLGLVLDIGDRLDIIGVVEQPQDKITKGKRIVLGAPVVYVPQKIIEKEQKKDESVIVALTPEQAEKVALAMVKGKLVAAINPIGGDLPATAGITLDRVLE
ncbi:flp pilus assembly protein CpaB [Desulfocucumis palustris]|uniref:Flp pilus assembly protein CpaB n=1 Tax=Desulfocucumis palustris TaxID=1898651 RepID=A0A2L2XJ67_9FIRM|nr:Flp pilus assembly protein CpaB [Desulfocucumis palustris]GBF33971.1 flp pilus assembly protein CpaB [Desulfocucumis palustris]